MDGLHEPPVAVLGRQSQANVAMLHGRYHLRDSRLCKTRRQAVSAKCSELDWFYDYPAVRERPSGSGVRSSNGYASYILYGLVAQVSWDR